MQRRSLVGFALGVFLFALAPCGTARAADFLSTLFHALTPDATVPAADASAPAADARVQAAGCLSAPDRAPDVGQHWYFRTERETNRKCWHLRKRATQQQGQARIAATTGSAASRSEPGSARRRDTSVASGSANEALFRDFLRWYRERGRTQ